MSRVRWTLLPAIAALSALLGYFLRDIVYQLVIVPVAYAWWVVSFYISAIPQWVIWTIVLAILSITVLWNMLPEGRRSRHPMKPARQPEGEVEALAIWLMKARHGNYFKWQLANRMGRIARRLDELSGSQGRPPSQDESVEKYLDAGLNYSFVDFLSPRGWFQRPQHTPLDINPRTVADYLESLMEKSSGRHR